MDYNEKLLQITSLPDCATIQQNIEKFLKNMVSQIHYLVEKKFIEDKQEQTPNNQDPLLYL